MRFRLPSPSIVIACTALIVALAGTSYAALSKNTVGSKQLKKGAVKASDLGKDAVTSAKVKNGSLLGADFKKGELPAGPEGPPGPPGPPNPNADKVDGIDSTGLAQRKSVTGFFGESNPLKVTVNGLGDFELLCHSDEVRYRWHVAAGDSGVSSGEITAAPGPGTGTTEVFSYTTEPEELAELAMTYQRYIEGDYRLTIPDTSKSVTVDFGGFEDPDPFVVCNGHLIATFTG
jgi:hypothetical protein